VGGVELVFVFVGRAKEAYLEVGWNDYVARIRRHLKAEVRLLKAEPRRKGTDEAQALAREAKRMEPLLASADHVICLDRAGKQLSSEELARHLEGLILRGVKRAALVVGGVGGLHSEVVARADLLLSLGPMTFTHEMSRLIIAEQVYRALSIRAGEPYHK
jgi:23S rRNA (pseudouridine1915-N3)-methyltransferase